MVTFSLDELEQPVVLRIRASDLVGEDPADVARVHVRSDWQSSGVERTMQLVRHEDAKD